MSIIAVTPVILCGGVGARLWPLSRSGFPKQFLSLTGDNSLFQQAILRNAEITKDSIHASAPVIVCNEEHRFLASEQLRETGVDAATLLLEPEPRNTAPALTLAALTARAQGADPVLVVCPADQAIGDQDAYLQAIRVAVQAAVDGHIIVLGISPDRPETGYGYIKSTSKSAVSAVDEFVEKPNLETAVAYLASGEYFWNAGIFVLKASVWLAAIEKFRPDIAASTLQAWEQGVSDHSAGSLFFRPSKSDFSVVPSESIDYAVIEKCAGEGFSVLMTRINAGWTDLGNWESVWNFAEKDAAGNTSQGDALLHDSRNNLVHATSRLVSLLGVDGLVVVETPDAVLVADRGSSQEVKNIVNTLVRQEREEHLLHRKVNRPWGWYDSIDEAARFKVKRIQVNPGASLSVQKHHHRAEHWIVVKGTAQVRCGEKTFLLSENQSTYIPLGEIHCLSNPGSIPLEIIEVQSGSYLGEDDIVRFEDKYGRGIVKDAA